VPLELPWGEPDQLRGVLDLLKLEAIEWSEDSLGQEFKTGPIPEPLLPRARAAREQLVEVAAECDDALLERYLAAGDLSPEEILRGLRRGVLELRITPVLCGSALRNKGIQPLLDRIVDLLPSPLEVPPVSGEHPTTHQTLVREAKLEAPLAALVFKVQSDSETRLVFTRIYSGRLAAGASVYNSSAGASEKVARLFRIHANQRERLDSAGAGEIVALAGLKLASTGDTLCAESDPVRLERIQFPEPVMSMAVEARTHADSERLLLGLRRLADDDPTFQFKYEEETGQTLISGMGELHLEILVERLRELHHVAVSTGQPQVLRKETVTKKASASGDFDKEIAGRRHFASVRLQIEPRLRGAGNQVAVAIAAGSAHQNAPAAAEKTLREALAGGVLGGYPVVDVAVTIMEIGWDGKDFSEMATAVATNLAFDAVCRAADPIYLEPVVRVDVALPEEYLGEVLGGLHARKGKVEAVSSEGEGLAARRVIHARMPLARMFGYSTELRSLTQGKGVYTMEFSHFGET
jgi:elongation factor G